MQVLLLRPSDSSSRQVTSDTGRNCAKRIETGGTCFQFEASEWMLKITKVVESNHAITLLLDGRVTGQWVDLLRESAESVLELGMRLTLDLENICFVDCEGLVLIKSLITRGVREVNAPLFVAEQIKKCAEAQGD